MKKTIILVFIIIFCTCPGFADEKIYKWTGDDGVLHFSDQPPEDEVEQYDTIKVAKDKSLPDTAINNESEETLRPGYNQMVENAKQEMSQYEQEERVLEIAKAKEEKEKTEAERLAKIEAKQKILRDKIDNIKKRPFDNKQWTPGFKNAQINLMQKQIDELEKLK
ncbi:MAG: DUF4124 domain-containing protein [Proteobacteria bacterium]|nr:DUF4124 domain-containing protein [Pseudomonadota bacterium]